MKNMKRKYLVISHNYYPALGGAEKLLQSIAENIKKEGLEVDVLTSNAKNSEMYFSKNPETIDEEREIINDVPVYREDIANFAQKFSNILRRMFVGDYAANIPEKNEGTGNRVVERMKRYVSERLKEGRGWGVDFAPLMIGPHFPKFVFNYLFSKSKYTHIICGPFPTLAPFYGYLIKLLKPETKLFIVPCIHINYEIHTGRMLRFIARRSDKILVLTPEETIFFKAIGVSAENIIEIGVGIDDYMLKQGKKGSSLSFRYILYLGQEVPHKNIILTIDAMKEVWRQHPSVKLVIAGARTAYSQVINDYIDKLGDAVKENITRVNDFDDAKKVELLDNCEMMVMPSSQESFGIVFIEAWSRKKAVIGANVPAVRYLIKENISGLLCEDRNSVDLSKKILFLLDHPEKAKELGEAGYRSVLEKYSWNIIIKKIITV
jgi:glycosyltransferase involved in cell wall biosynthesis